MNFNAGLCLALLVLPTSALAQDLTPIVDMSMSASTGTTVGDSFEPMPYEPSAATKMAESRYDLMQGLRDEVRLLRGMVEELKHELQQVKQRQLDDYLDIDRRLGSQALDGNNADSASIAAKSLVGAPLVQERVDGSINDRVTDSASVNGFILPAVDDDVVKIDYETASNMLLKARDIDGAATALKLHLEKYPTSLYTANAHYWLGEIYLLQRQDELARQSFTTIIEQYPNHPKVMDSNFKLGKIYFQLGQNKLARRFLETAAASSGGVASKAQSYLDSNF
ncbi:MAG: tetratricopeptide repeat protein [Proteobacteria bacterium]|nr:tetratricopeptide repeat protein [Pseudomonadota bacterium]MDA1352183.1 tetratricopeptide repeat protein [Pseudomonadota bacterium]